MSGLEIIHAVQSISNPFLDRFFRFFTDLHDITVYVAIIPLLIWFYDKRFARYMISVLILGIWANNVLKDLFHTARPPAGEVRKLYEETGTGYAFPSGHAMNPLMFWGGIAIEARKRWLTVLLAVGVFLIGLSRIYAGLHWPLDVLGGWAIGALMLWGFQVTKPVWIGAGLRLPTQLLWSVLIPPVTLAVSLYLIRETQGFPVDTQVAGEAWMLAGAYMGLMVGSFLEEAYVGFNPRAGGPAVQVLKLVIGLLLMLGVKEGLKPLFPDTALFEALRYLCVGITATYIAPLIFKRFAPAAPPMGTDRAQKL